MKKTFRMRSGILCIIICCASLSLSLKAQTVSTLAGTGTSGSTEGAGASASFNTPWGVAVDASGNVYVADQINNKIRKVTPAGIVSTFAGSGTSGNAEGTGTGASFNYPTAVAVDVNGNVYVADQSNNKIRKITPAGVVSTLAGSGSYGSSDGSSTTASFKSPSGIAVDASGNVYVGDTGNNTVRKITPAGMVSTLAGSGTSGSVNGTSTAASFNGLIGLAVDASGNVYVADLGNRIIRKITSAGVVSTFAGSGTTAHADGLGTSASFEDPNAVATDANGNLYVTEGTSKIRKISPAGLVSTISGTGYGNADGTIAIATFNVPTGIVVDAFGNVYIADRGNNKIRKISGLITAIEEAFINSEKASVYPNPAKEILYTNSVFNEKAYQLVDMSGREILSGIVNSSGIYISGLNQGIYFLQISTGNGIIVEKFVKE